MFSRLESSFLIDLPSEWSLSMSELLNTNYQNYLEAEKKSFEVYGKLYKGELVIIASLVKVGSETDIPTSYFVSMELLEGQDYTKHLATLVDSVGAFFETFFADPHWMDYLDQWQEEEFEGLKIHYKVNRENIALTLRAEQLLNQ